MRAEQEMPQLMCGNDTQNRSLTGPATVVQLRDSIIEGVTVGSRAILAKEGDAVDVGLQCPSLMLNAQDEMAAVYRLYASLTFQLGCARQFFQIIDKPASS